MIKLYSFHLKSKTLQFCFCCFRPPLSSGNEENEFQIATKMRYLSTQTNHLQMEVESGNLLKKRYSLKKIVEAGICVAEFPIYTAEEIRGLTLGVYQVRLARYYTQGHIDPDHEYFILG